MCVVIKDPSRISRLRQFYNTSRPAVLSLSCEGKLKTSDLDGDAGVLFSFCSFRFSSSTIKRASQCGLFVFKVITTTRQLFVARKYHPVLVPSSVVVSYKSHRRFFFRLGGQNTLIQTCCVLACERCATDLQIGVNDTAMRQAHSSNPT